MHYERIGGSAHFGWNEHQRGRIRRRQIWLGVILYLVVFNRTHQLCKFVFKWFCICNGVGVGYYQFNGNIWSKVIFTIDVGSANTLDIINYNGLANLNIEVTLADYIGEYELGKRDVPGGCLDLSFLKQKEIDDVC